jgi:hypothetical protein
MTITHGHGWTGEHIERLAALRAERNPRLSAPQIGEKLTEEFGILRTRNAVLGASHRAGLCVSRPEENKLRAAEKRLAIAIEPGPAPANPFPRSTKLKPPTVVCDEPFEGGVTFDELRSHHCRWIPGDPSGVDTRYCGKRTDRSSYCSGHHARAIAGVWSPARRAAA